LKSVALTVLELFNAQKFRGSRDHGHAPFYKRRFGIQRNGRTPPKNKVAIKFLRQNKSVMLWCKMFAGRISFKQWSFSGLKRLLKKIDETGSVERWKGESRPRSVRCDIEQL